MQKEKTMTDEKMVQLAINTIRTLSIDAVQQAKSGHPGTPMALADFEKLTRIPIQVVYGDNIPANPYPVPGPDLWRARQEMAALFVVAVNRHGGDAQLLKLPEIGVFGNTHFVFTDLNNVKIADLMSKYLHQKGLDKRGKGQDED